MYGSLTGFKQFIKVSASDTTWDNTYTKLLNLASEGVETYCGRKFELTPYVEYYSGQGTPNLVLRNRPVRSVASVYVDETGYFGDGTDAFASTTLKTVGQDYVLRRDDRDGSASKSGLLIWLGRNTTGAVAVAQYQPGVLSPGVSVGGWPVGMGNIKVTYIAGYDPIPSDVETGTYLLAQTLLAQSENNQFQVTGENLGPFSVTKSQLTYYARETVYFSSLLKRYREVAL